MASPIAAISLATPGRGLDLHGEDRLDRAAVGAQTGFDIRRPHGAPPIAREDFDLDAEPRRGIAPSQAESGRFPGPKSCRRATTHWSVPLPTRHGRWRYRCRDGSRYRTLCRDRATGRRSARSAARNRSRPPGDASPGALRREYWSAQGPPGILDPREPSFRPHILPWPRLTVRLVGSASYCPRHRSGREPKGG